MATNTMPHREILVLGDASVGKSALIHHFCTGDFPSEEDKLSTDKRGDTSSRSRVVSIDNVRTHLIIHRFNEKDERSAEQSALWDSWYRFANVIIIVYSITSYSSFLLARSFFDRIQQSRQNKLLPPASGGAGIHGRDPNRHLDANSRPDILSLPVILLGNKVDLDQHRQVNRQEAALFAHAHGILHMEIDAKLKADVDNVFVQAARMVQYSKDGVIRHGGLVANPSPSNPRSRATPPAPNTAPVSPVGAIPIPNTSSPEAHHESRLGRFFQIGRRRGSSAAAANNPNATNTTNHPHRRVSKDEGIEGAPERALEYHRAGSRGGGGGGSSFSSFSSFSSTASRWGTGRENTSPYQQQHHAAPTSSSGPQQQHQLGQEQTGGRLDLDLGDRFELSSLYRRGNRGQ